MSTKLSGLGALMCAAALGVSYDAPGSYTVGVTSAAQHDPERLAAAIAKRERKAAKKAKEDQSRKVQL